METQVYKRPTKERAEFTKSQYEREGKNVEIKPSKEGQYNVIVSEHSALEPEDFKAKNVSEVEQLLESGSYDADFLNAVLKVEQENKNRKTAKEAILNALNEIEENG